MIFDVVVDVNTDLLEVELQGALGQHFVRIDGLYGDGWQGVTVVLRDDVSDSDVVLARKIVAEHDPDKLTGEQRREEALWQEVRNLRQGVVPDLEDWEAEDIVRVLRLVYLRVEGLNCKNDPSLS